MKNQTPMRIGRGFDWRSNDRIGLLLDQLDPAGLLSVLLEGLFEPLL
jgi:hypothetical protein